MDAQMTDGWCDSEGGGCEVGPIHPAEIYTL